MLIITDAGGLPISRLKNPATKARKHKTAQNCTEKDFVEFGVLVISWLEKAQNYILPAFVIISIYLMPGKKPLALFLHSGIIYSDYNGCREGFRFPG